MTDFVTAPTVERNPNENVPLVALVRFRTSEPVATRIAVDDGRRTRAVAYDASHDPADGLPIIGMRADTDHRITVAAGDIPPVTLTYRTPPLPVDSAEWPIIATRIAKASDMQPGFTLLSVRRTANIRQTFMTPAQVRFTTRWGMLMAVDEAGEVVWYYVSDARIAGVTQLANGNLFFHHVDFRSVEMDMTGRVIRMFYASGRPGGPVEGAIPIEAASLHHQPHQMPNGNFLAMTANARMIEDYFTSETDAHAPRRTQPVVGDRFVEFTPAGEIVWSWDTFDHLDVYRWSYHLLEVYWHNRGFPHHLDWTHGNGITYDPGDDSVIVSLRHQDALIKIDKASGEIAWILGDHGNWKSPQKEKLLAPEHELRWHYHGHNPRVTADGTVLMYDNGICRAQPYDPQAAPHECFARAVEYEVDEAARTVREVWTSSDDDDPERVISWAMGDAHRLANDNMLIVDSICLPMREQLTASCHVRDLTWNEWKREEWHPNDMPYWTRVREMKRDASREVVFELHLEDPHELVGWQTFGGARVASLYPPGVEDTRSFPPRPGAH
ncbi:MAG: aryl-sulfate sulfotransferase [Defluviicoccus sp.]|nr:aryl-sulfate sulfotransferase [Defluviicoccus sp.]